MTRRAVRILLLDRPRIRHVADVLEIARAPFDLDRRRLVGVEEELRGVEIVDAPGAAETSDAVIADEQPGERDAHIAIRHPRRRPEPHVVVEACRRLLQRLGRLRLGRPSAGRSDHDVADVTDVAVPDQLRRVAVEVAGSLLRAPLEDDPVFLDRLAQREAFRERHAQRLFAIDVLAAAGRLDADERMPSFAWRDDDRVDVLPRQELAKIGEAQAGLVAVVLIDRGLELLERFLADVADRDDADVGHLQESAHVAAAHPADADVPERDAVARRRGLRSGDDVPGHDHRRHRRDRGGAQELATIYLRTRSRRDDRHFFLPWDASVWLDTRRRR